MFRNPSKMPYNILVNTIKHLEAVKLTRDYANAMAAALPALKAALKVGVTGMSVAHDVKLWEEAVPKLKGWMGGSDGDCYRCEENLAKLRAELALRDARPYTGEPAETQKQTDLDGRSAALLFHAERLEKRRLAVDRLNAGED
jgi:hypothetical protein